MVSIFNDKDKHVQYCRNEQQDESIEVNPCQDRPRVIIRELSEDTVDIISVQESEQSYSSTIQIYELTAYQLNYNFYIPILNTERTALHHKERIRRRWAYKKA